MHEIVTGYPQLEDILLQIVYNKKPDIFINKGQNVEETNQQHVEIFMYDSIKQKNKCWQESPYVNTPDPTEVLDELFEVDLLKSKCKNGAILKSACIDINESDKCLKVLNEVGDVIAGMAKEELKAEKKKEKAAEKEKEKKKEANVKFKEDTQPANNEDDDDQK